MDGGWGLFPHTTPHLKLFSTDTRINKQLLKYCYYKSFSGKQNSENTSIFIHKFYIDGWISKFQLYRTTVLQYTLQSDPQTTRSRVHSCTLLRFIVIFWTLFSLLVVRRIKSIKVFIGSQPELCY